MRILSTSQFVVPKLTKYETKTTNQKQNYQSPQAQSFGRALNYHDFLTEMRKVCKNKSLKNVVLSTIADKKNYIGSGFNANAYNIPGVDDYIIRIERKTFTPQSFIQNPITEETQNALAPNFGQFVASNNFGFFINKKVFGESHSLSNWAEKIKAVEYGQELTHTDAKTFLNKIHNIAEFPLQSYTELAQKIRKLNKFTESEIDIINPNNLIIDNENKKFGIIDLWYKHKENGNFPPYNGIDSMINLMLDPFLHKRAYGKLSNTDGDKLKLASETIIKKVFKASETAGLVRTKDGAMVIYKDMDKRLPDHFAVTSYSDFLDMYKNLL